MTIKTIKLMTHKKNTGDLSIIFKAKRVKKLIRWIYPFFNLVFSIVLFWCLEYCYLCHFNSKFIVKSKMNLFFWSLKSYNLVLEWPSFSIYSLKYCNYFNKVFFAVKFPNLSLLNPKSFVTKVTWIDRWTKLNQTQSFMD